MLEKSPPNAKDVQSVVEERLAAVANQSGIQETVTIEWRGSQVSIPVISMPLDLLSYNPGTHRVRAQRSLDPARDREVNADPFSASAQAYLHALLMGDPADPAQTDPSFEALKEDLEQHGQTDPGIISRSGILINGNTRRAALKELGQQNIRVGVLSPDAALEDLDSIELSLQLRKDHKRDYSFMNFLLAVNERVEANWPAAKIQSEFRIKAKTLERSQWILQAVREVIDRSRTTGPGGTESSMRLVDFEKHQGKLEELHRAYVALKNKSPEDAEKLREQRLLAIALDKSKTDARLIEPDFSERYMKQIIPADGGASPNAVKIPGTNITTSAPSEKVQALRTLTDEVLQAKATCLSPETATPEAVTKAGNTIRKVEQALEKGLDQAGKTGRVIKRRYAPVDRLSDANDDLELSISAVAEARATNNFDAEDLDEALTTLRANLVKLAQIAARDDDNAEGLVWLRTVARLPEPSST